MSRRIAIVGALLALAACDAKTDGGSGGAKVSESGPARGSAGGFSAQMSSELAKAGIGDPPGAAGAGSPGASGTASPGASGTGVPGASGSGATTDQGTGSQVTGQPIGSQVTAQPIGSQVTTQPIGSQGGAGSTGAGSPGGAGAGSTGSPGATGAVATGAGSPGGAGAGSTGSPGAGATGAGATGAGSPGGAGASSMTAVGAVKAPATRAYAKPAPDIAAIKLDLEPNWERDMGEAGTFSLVVKVPNTDDTRVFSVRYGYEDASAPIDCDQYRKFLEDRGAMKVSLNRQKGGACYIEGTDQAGVLAFRMLATYGGKRLLCHGSLYKDPASSSLGDLRDKVLMQAKKICETLAL